MREDDDTDEDSSVDPREDLASQIGQDDAAPDAFQDAEGDPKSLSEARSRADRLCWQAAMDRELKALERTGTWAIALRPEAWNLKTRWIFKTKRNPDGSIKKYKARLVTQHLA